MKKENVRVISPDEFCEDPDYTVVSLTYYADGVLTAEDDEVIVNPARLIGPDALDSFGEYEDDSVFVVDDDEQCYYEILKDLRYFADIEHA